MKIKSFILLFFLLLLPQLNSNALCKTGDKVENCMKSRKHLKWTSKDFQTRAPGLAVTGYLENQSLFLSFNQSFNDARVVIIDAVTGSVVYDSRITGNSLIVPSIDESCSTLYLEITIGDMKITGEIDLD